MAKIRLASDEYRAAIAAWEACPNGGVSAPPCHCGAGGDDPCNCPGPLPCDCPECQGVSMDDLECEEAELPLDRAALAAAAKELEEHWLFNVPTPAHAARMAIRAYLAARRKSEEERAVRSMDFARHHYRG